MRYQKLLEKLTDHQKEVAEQIKAAREGADLKDVCDRLFVTLGRTTAIVMRFDSDEQVGIDA